MKISKFATLSNRNSMSFSKPRSRTSVLWSAALHSCFLLSLFSVSYESFAAAATPTSQVGDTVTNPTTNVDVTVFSLILDPNDANVANYVITSDGKTLLTKTLVGDTLTLDNAGTLETYDIISVTTNATSGLVDSVEMRLNTLPATDPTTTLGVVSTSTANFDVPTGSQGAPATPATTPPTTTSGVINEVSVGAGGSNGSDGYGIEICDPFFGLGCTVIGYGGSAGGDGATGPTVNRTINSSHGLITSTASNVPGIKIGSVGGDGGTGGDAFGNFDGLKGGDAGAGGRVTVTNHTEVNVGGTSSHGLFVFSRSGNAGAGGTGFILGGGGAGGAARDGGTVTVSNDGSITTSGDGGHGIYGLSVAGSAGAGGDSWGIVGTGGNGATAGNGGVVSITNSGTIITKGNSAHGILAQSIGGSGGDAGVAGGLVATGGNGSGGGNARTASVTNSGSIFTDGDDARGIMAQSIGGGGGAGGGSGGLVALGGDGGAAGNGGTASVTNNVGGNITTKGDRSDAIYAQSIGGGGGSGGGTGGLVASSSGGGGAGHGSTVTVTNRGILQTQGSLSRGIFVQSIGGGGGSGGGSGGLVALSGDGGGAGNGGTVTVKNFGAITTGLSTGSGNSSDAIYAQSIGGGGGSGAGAGGLVASGGSGGGSGNGGIVRVTNSGVLETAFDDSAGIFAQSVGGGGGAGAGSGGLVALGGDGGGSGFGGAVTVTNNAGGDILTLGDRSAAIYAQSVGGGGGSGAGSGGLVAVSGSGGGSSKGGTVAVTNRANLRTTGDQARGIFAQSIGGGGGAGGGAGGLVALSGAGGGAGSGSAVTVTNTGSITTGLTGVTGKKESDAIFAQSIGGGGGNGAGSGGLVGVSGSGGGSGNGGTVGVTNSGALATVFDDSFGIFAQSVGGGGGSGGGSGGLVALGGSGSAGGIGGAVTVTNNAGGSISTLGDRSGAIYAQSGGGGGGSGAGSGGLVAVSGSGGGSGNGGTVTISSNAALSTIGDQARGIFAQSVGGGGGAGGGGGGLVALSGGGGGAGSGSTVTVTNTGSITTGLTGVTGENDSYGIFAQSVGGGGGSGAGAGGLVAVAGSGSGGGTGGNVTVTNNTGGSITALGDRSGAIHAQSVGGGGGSGSGSGGLVAVSGTGGGSGAGGAVTVSSNATLRTAGDQARGIFAQSIGGGGGSGGGSGGLVALAGDGGGAGNGAAVSVTNTGSITTGVTGVTGKKESDAIFAQSIGGGGGTGAGSGGLVALAGSGGGAGNGAAVTVTNSGELITVYDNSRGIFAQSVGGGGGSGDGVGGLVALGGGGSGGGSGGNVLVTNNLGADITTFGDGSDAIFAQSVGGGGGSADASGGLVALGGGGVGGGAAGTVTVINDATLFTDGDRARGIFAQSIAGGGGSAGDSGGLVSIGGDSSASSVAKKVTVENSGLISTSGQSSTGIFAQSIGGGGGDGGGAGGVISIGGDGGAGNHAGEVAVTHGNVIETNGDDSYGIFAQSVGGGGGNGGGAYSGGLFAGLALGGEGASGGDGGLVNVGLTPGASIVTRQDRSVGLLAQSVGGGGGNGGTAIQATVGAFFSASVAIGGDAGGGGIGGTVGLTGDGDVLTLGNNSGGVVLQSVGGGGGNGGTTVSAGLTIGDGAVIGVALGGTGGAGGKGGVVTADVDSIIETRGEFSTGFLAQSVGGGGGNGGTTIAASAAVGVVGAAALSVSLGGDAGTGGVGDHVDVTLGGSVLTRNVQSDGVVIQSIGGGGGNGGLTVAAGASGAGVGAANVTVGVGGSGGGGGVAGRVDADIDSDVETLGDGSDGVVIQTIGGGGGNSGLTVSAGLSGAGVGAGGINVGVGGDGGGGGSGDIVDAKYKGDLITRGDNATGLLAQSVGGGGGNSGGTIAASLNGAGVGAGSIAVGIGGSGGTASHGGRTGVETAVTLDTEGTVTTFGDNSSAIIAQSIGGGGGNGGYSVAGTLAGAGVGAGAISVGLGGSAGGGGNGKGVDATLASTIWTDGDVSLGALIQSVGGGGGNGGFNVSGALSGAGVGSGGISVGLGGTGGDGGLGGRVNASSTGTIRTNGDRSSGFVAQSIGGGGGNGGFNVAGSLSGAGVGSGVINVGLGGDSGPGSHAGVVVASTSANVVTLGKQSLGILAQSVGGGGGNAGLNVAAGASGAGVGSGAIDVGLGGSGSGGGNGGSVTLTVNNDVYTDEDQSAAVTAQSIGGGGGSGGFNVSAGLSGGGVGSGTIGIGLGGDGGSGGNGSTVTASITGDVQTRGDDSGGILAQSVGGGGGSGALNVSGSLSGAGVGSGGISVGVGGAGSVGGNADAVNLTTNGNVITVGDISRGVVAQSIGGGGGNGGMSIDIAASGAGTGSGAVAVSVGGSGGDGGLSDRVDAVVTGDIGTTGDFSDGLVVQTIGGGGGNGALNIAGSLSGAGVGNGTVSVSVGSSGGAGGDSNIVTAAYDGTLVTDGDHATGMLVQAIGGGGGNGGGTIAAGAGGAGTGSGAISVAVGGSGGASGDGGLAGVDTAVTATASGQIATYGDYSSAFVAQSIGGGGGNGGYSVNANLSGAGTASGAIGVGLGGSGAGGGLGKGVNTNVSSKIWTFGNDSVGMLSQSVGGGGGNGGFNVTAGLSGAGTASGAISVGLGGAGATGGKAGNVDATASDTIYTEGNNSGAFIAQSIGGGGGNGGFTVSAAGSGAGTASGAIGVSLGGDGDVGGNGGEVKASTSGDILTLGDNSGGILAQSVGGGGGNGGFNVTGGLSGAGTASGAVGVGLGGTGAGGGDGSIVDLTVRNDVTTEGENSAGIVAQSIGGGGGNGGFNVAALGSGAGTGSGAVGVGLGGSSDGGGDADAVTLDAIGNILTGDADNSAGVIVQSVGGGGGNGGFNVTATISGAKTGSGTAGVGLGGSAGGGGSAGDVTSSLIGNVETGGNNSTGLLVQSVGGGGGNGAFNVTGSLSGAGTGSAGAAVGLGGSGGDGGTSGIVTSVYTGDVFTRGERATGVIAQSVAGGGGNGGFTVAAAISAAKTGSAAVSVGIGGSGGGGGNSNIVNNTVTGNIVAEEAGSGGVLAQSVGGGGGNGGLSVSGSISLAKTVSGAVSVGIGGSGGDGGDSANVTNAVTGTVFTSGAGGSGVVAQSLGGGGGNGGINVSGTISASKTAAGAIGVGVGGTGGGGGNAADVVNTVSGYVQTLGDDSTGILAQSLGGGGGNGGLNVTGAITAAKTGSGNIGVGVGGFGGDGGDGAEVTNTVTGGIITAGNNSDAILAQSLGGGGGNGAINVTGTINITKSNGGTLGVGIGGFGGNGGDSAKVTSTVTTTEQFGQIGTTGDHSSAVVAQSIAGGGGNGALNVTGAINLTGKNGAAIGVGVGGFGGGAGNAGEVILDVTGPVVTQGNDSHGLLAQSIGGGGGNGGTNVTGSLAFTKGDSDTTAVAGSIGVGGFGGDGGTAGDVEVIYEGTIVAQPRVLVAESVDIDTGEIIPAHFEFKEGTGSHGLAAQSIGGGGGNGGVNVSAGISYGKGDGDGQGLVVGVGGFGGGGGDAGDVDVTVNGGESIFSGGAGHSAVLAQSIGGGGGNGATNVSGGIVSDSSLIVGVGGFAGDAGIAKDVTVDVTADVFASGDSTKVASGAGILAQSLGGGGGNGGMNVSGGISLSKEGSIPSITVGIGGFGGAGAISGDVNVNHDGNSITSGEWVHGIMAQSIAGGGGNGGLNVSGQLNWADSDNSGGKTDLSIVAGIGGSGGDSADAGDVSVTASGIVTTSGDNARGVAAQSIGGGGGTGGMNVTGVFTKNSAPISVGVGGTGGSGGNAGSVIIERGTETASAGKVTTDGDGAYGIEASSIGGGGGDAGMNFIVGISRAGSGSNDSSFAAQFAIGGGGGAAGDGDTSEVYNYSDIETKQKNSHGIIAQSIGGGGGNANLNIAVTHAGADKENMGFSLAVGGAPGDGGNGAAVDALNVGNIETFGNNSFGILSQSIGGGGGNAGLDFGMTKTDGGKIAIKIGREGGTGGFGGDVTLSSDGSVITHGDGSFGLLAQSIGNGGGNSSSTTVSATAPKDGDKTGKSASLAIGLDGGVGGYAGDVTLDAAGWVSTDGKNAHAIFAQSVGGGGGNAGSASTAGITAASASLAIGGTGGEGGIGGIVNVTSSAEVRTNNVDSVGILAQSIGGGGGNGSDAKAGGLKAADGVRVAIGGDGGVGMTGGEVNVDNSGVIITDGDGSHGVLAQSLGGGGGNSGMVINSIARAKTDSATQLAISIGGDGGEGANSSDVTVTNTGGIGTNDANSVGIFAQSIGGGGGNAKTVVTGTVSGTGGGNNFSMGIGGSGGTGAAGGNVTVSNLKDVDVNSGKIITLGNNSHGIMAMSIGGGGGNGSTTISSTRSVATASATTKSFAFSLGGEGGAGGTGGDVEVFNDGEITTYGYNAHGIIAQSVGGGGGNGGMSVTGDFALGTTPAQPGGKAGSISVGGFGGDGNASGDVTITNDGSIEVFGDKAYGIYAQSVGGGGGDGGFSTTLSRNILTNPKTDLAKSLMNFAVGGNGGDGADSGDVLVEHNGTIISHGDDSYGIFAQSIGGGGGNVGNSITSPAWMAADFAISTLLGGRDGSKGTAGTVTVNTTGDIVMLGANSQAQFTQSVNGGGGNVELFLDFSEQAVALGDDGFELPDNGGIVEQATAFVNSTIELGTTAIQDATGSVIDATHVGDLITFGEDSYASLIQSIGGGGGNAKSEIVADSNADIDLVLSLGGAESSNNDGGAVDLTRDGDVGTAGAQSQGVSVQSIGGGGGNLAVDVVRVPAPEVVPVAGTGFVAEGEGLVSTAGKVALAALPLNTATVILGSDLSDNNDGGAMNLNFTGDTSTAGEMSAGLVTQSIGGGGGQLSLTGLDTLVISVGATGNSTGNGANVSLSNTGSILTEGGLSHGIVIQSIGGGGGLALTDLDEGNIALTLNTDNSGNGGSIDFDQTGDVVVNGDRSIGILAQSLGGGGGVVDRLFADTAGGAGISSTIDLNLDGNVIAQGQDGVAIFAQSRGADGQGDINITLTDDKLVFAGENGVGVWISGGANNLFSNRGTVITADGLLGWALIGEDGNDVINNFGTIYGQIDLGDGVNTFMNRVDNFFIPGEQVLLGGASSQLINDGVLMPGDMLFAQHTDMTGSFVQTATGVTLSELDFSSDVIDNISMTGAAELAGEIEVSLLNPQLVPIGHFQKDLFVADLGVTDNNLVLTTAPSVVILYDLIYPTFDTAALDFNVDFNVEGMGRNLQQVGEYFNRVQIAGSSPALADTVTKLLFDPTIEIYRESLSQLSPDFYAEHQAATIRSSQRFGQTMANQGEDSFGQDPANDADYRFADNEQVFWFQFDSEDNTHESFDDYKLVNHYAEGFSMGIHKQLDDKWSYGLGFSYEDNKADGYDGRWVSSGDTRQIGFELKHQSGSSQIALIQTYGWSQSDIERVGQVTDAFETKANRELETYGAILRFSDVVDQGSMYVRTALDLGLTRLMADSAKETGAEATNLELESYDENHTWIKPTLGLGYKHLLKSRTKMNVYANIGLHHYFSNPDTEVIAGLEGAPEGVDPMRVPVELGQSYVEGAVGVDFMTTDKVSLGLQYSTIFYEEHTDFDRLTLDLSIPF